MWSESYSDCSEEDSAASRSVSYFVNCLKGYEWMNASRLHKTVYQAPVEVKRFIKKYYRKDKFVDFLNAHPSFFYLANGKVAEFKQSLPEAYDAAVWEFWNILSDYNGPVEIRRFKGHIGQASKEVKYFINSFYPRSEFKTFLAENSDLFIVYEDDTVWLIDLESADYFKKTIETYGGGEYYLDFRGHIGQASRPVIDFMNENYPDEKFLKFLEIFSDTFDVDDEGFVFLK